MKPDFDTLVTVPDDPPAAGADRACDPPPAAPGAAAWALEAGCAADAAGDARKPTESPIVGAKSAAATMLRHFLFVSTRRTFGLRSCGAVITPADQSGEDTGEGGAAASVSLETVASDGRVVALVMARAGCVSSGFVGS